MSLISVAIMGRPGDLVSVVPKAVQAGGLDG